MAAPTQITSSNRLIRATNSITTSNFAAFGEVIHNPATHSESEHNDNGQWRLEYTTANHGTATKWIDVSHLENWYHAARSGKMAKSVVNMFVCRPRKLEDRDGKKVFPVGILERHPYTPQTFIPMGAAKNDPNTRYLVIVAPTLPAKARAGEHGKPYPTPEPGARRKKSLRERLLGARPNPFTNDYAPSTTPPIASLPPGRKPKGRGLPDLDNLRAFIVRGDQAVTYGPGTWHAPMVVLGEKEIEFVVVQYANGVNEEDCQEVVIKAESGASLAVQTDDSYSYGDDNASAPGIMRAKL